MYVVYKLSRAHMHKSILSRTGNRHVRKPRREHSICCRCCYPSRYARLLSVIVLLLPSIRKKTNNLSQTSLVLYLGVYKFLFLLLYLHLRVILYDQVGDAVELARLPLFPWGCQVAELRRSYSSNLAPPPCKTARRRLTLRLFVMG